MIVLIGIKRLGFFGIEIKYNDIFEIGYNLYNQDMNYDEIYGYKCMSLNDCLKLKKKTNREKDKEIIKILEKRVNNM